MLCHETRRYITQAANNTQTSFEQNAGRVDGSRMHPLDFLHDRRQYGNIKLRSSEIPFSIESLQSIRTINSGEIRASNVHEHDSSESKQQSKAERLEGYMDGDRCDRWFKRGQWLLLIVAIFSVIFVAWMLSSVFDKVEKIVDTVSGPSMQAKIDGMLDSALGAALNTETATANAAAMTEIAKGTLEEANPRFMDVLNQSSSMFTQLRAFSTHPAWTLSAGSFGRRQR